MQLQVTFEQTTAADAEALASLRVEAMQESLQRVGRFDPQRARDRFLSSFSPSHTRHILLGGQRVGFFAVKPEATGLLLDHLYVQPGYQGKGLGAVALREVFSQADQEGLPLRVGALKESDSNRFYVRHGFVLVEQAEFDNYYVRHATNAL
ncbi:MAG: GNAT family N-acetyltransferase [Rhizobacter sp.]|nr:GNAT family N-acetyltransferase [Rhizobacter sp.]